MAENSLPRRISSVKQCSWETPNLVPLRSLNLDSHVFLAGSHGTSNTSTQTRARMSGRRFEHSEEMWAEGQAGGKGATWAMLMNS